MYKPFLLTVFALLISLQNPQVSFSQGGEGDHFFTEISETTKDKICGGIKYSVLNLGRGGFGGNKDHIKIKAFNEKGELIFEEDSTSSVKLGCRDITNDGIPELVVDTWGGGNCGCCNNFFALTTKHLEGKSHVKVLLQEEGFRRIEDLDDDGISEIIACHWAGYGEKANLESDKTLCFKDGKYIECTLKIGNKNEDKQTYPKVVQSKNGGYKVVLGIFETKLLAEIGADLLKKGLTPEIEQRGNTWELFLGPYPSKEEAYEARP
jgi:hypothetical protein